MLAILQYSTILTGNTLTLFKMAAIKVDNIKLSLFMFTSIQDLWYKTDDCSLQISISFFSLLRQHLLLALRTVLSKRINSRHYILLMTTRSNKALILFHWKFLTLQDKWKRIITLSIKSQLSVKIQNSFRHR